MRSVRSTTTSSPGRRTSQRPALCGQHRVCDVQHHLDVRLVAPPCQRGLHVHEPYPEVVLRTSRGGADVDQHAEQRVVDGQVRRDTSVVRSKSSRRLHTAWTTDGSSATTSTTRVVPAGPVVTPRELAAEQPVPDRFPGPLDDEDPEGLEVALAPRGLAEERPLVLLVRAGHPTRPVDGSVQARDERAVELVVEVLDPYGQALLGHGLERGTPRHGQVDLTRRQPVPVPPVDRRLGREQHRDGLAERRGSAARWAVIIARSSPCRRNWGCTQTQVRPAIGSRPPGTGVSTNAYEEWNAASRPGWEGSSIPYVRPHGSGCGQATWSSSGCDDGNPHASTSTMSRRRSGPSGTIGHGAHSAARHRQRRWVSLRHEQALPVVRHERRPVFAPGCPPR